MKTVYTKIIQVIAFGFSCWAMAAYGQIQPVPLTYSVTLVKDIRPGNGGSYGAKDMVAIGSTLYFVAGESTYGGEVWKTTGTSASTVLLKDINPNGTSSPDYLTNVNETLFFVATGPSGRELYKSNGTTAGTVLVKDINPQGDANPGSLFNYNGTLLFFADNGPNGMELWRSDGTSASTVMVKNINQNGDSYPTGFNGKMAMLNGIAYFIANDGITGDELWRTDGTAAGTYLVKNVRPNGSAGIIDLVVANNLLFFTADDGVNGEELWKSDGTSAGTMMVKDLQSSGSLNRRSYLIPVGSTVFFSAGVDGDVELYKSDGTASGTVRVKNINSQASSLPYRLTRVGNLVYFTANDGVHGEELWKSDGTSAGTVMVKDISPGSASSNIGEMTAAGGRLFFSIDDDEPYFSNGTAEGTLQLANINPTGFAVPRTFTGVGNTVYFFAGNSEVGRELFKAVPCTYCAVLVSARLSAEEDNHLLDLTILPNPVQTILTVDIKGGAGTPMQVDLYNAQGIPIERRHIDQPGSRERQEFEVEHQPPGIMMLRVTSANKTQSAKIIKVD